MNITVYTVNEGFAVSEAYVMFRTMGLRHLPVVNCNNKVKGMITKIDLLEHSCIEKYKELKRYFLRLLISSYLHNIRLKKMKLDLLKEEEEIEESMPGTPAPERETLSDGFRKRFTPSMTPARSPTASLSSSQVIYAIDPPADVKS